MNPFFEQGSLEGALRISPFGMMLLGGSTHDMNNEELKALIAVLISCMEVNERGEKFFRHTIADVVQGSIDRIDLDSIPVAEV